MTDLHTSTKVKTPGLGAGLADRHQLRSAYADAAFLCPHLMPGMSVLDIGCGPGSITLGLAEIVAPGTVVGIDVDAQRIDQARALANERGITNAAFVVGDAAAVCFEDQSFDACFEHSVFMHIPDARRAAHEVLRVLKPGGVFGASDADSTSLILYPDDPLILRGVAIQRAWREQHAGNYDIGRTLRSLLHEVGFTDAQATAGFEHGGYGTDADVRYWASIVDKYFQTPEMLQFAKDNGLGDAQTFSDIRAAWTRWSLDPGAFLAIPQIQALAWKPE